MKGLLKYRIDLATVDKNGEKDLLATDPDQVLNSEILVLEEIGWL